MKKIYIFLLTLIALCFSIAFVKAQYSLPFVSYSPTFNVTYRNLSQIILDDGFYDLTVECESNSSNTRRYILEVLIENDNIVRINFDNGGSLHKGLNNSGYTWRGGGIKWEVDYRGNIVRGKAVIHVDYGGGRWQLFTIYF